MARRRFLVRDIAEILEHWQARRRIGAISRSLETIAGKYSKQFLDELSSDDQKIFQGKREKQ